MGIAVMLKSNRQMDRFHSLIVGMINEGIGDEIVLSSGYFQEEYIQNVYPQFHASSSKANYKVLINGTVVLKTISFAEACKNNIQKITLICGKWSKLNNKYLKVIAPTERSVSTNEWNQSYRNFVINLSHIYSTDSNELHAYANIKGNWHAKVFILLKDGEPVAGIIGSSNMTRPAIQNNGFFNIESDVLLFSEKSKDTCEVINNILSPLILISGDGEEASVYLVNNTLNLTGGRTEVDVLNKHLDEIRHEIFNVLNGNINRNYVKLK